MGAEVNPCIESGCRGGCCRNIFMVDRRTKVEASFPGAIEVKPEEMPGLGDMAKGVYYIDHPTKNIPDGVYALIQGRCPNLGPLGSCAIYESNMRPHSCENFQRGSVDCNDIRYVLKLHPARTI